MAEKNRSRLWCVLLYPEDETHMQALELIRSTYNYVGILHDKDTWTEEDEKQNPEHKAGGLKKPHYHLILKFTQARWNTALAADLGIAVNYLEQCRNFDNAAVYLVHYGLDDKYQYDISELEGALAPDVEKLLKPRSEKDRVSLLLSLIDGMGWITYRDVVCIALENDLYSDVRRMGYILGRIIDEHNSAFKEMPFDKRFDDFCKFTSDKGLDNLPPL